MVTVSDAVAQEQRRSKESVPVCVVPAVIVAVIVTVYVWHSPSAVGFQFTVLPLLEMKLLAGEELTT